MTMGDRPYTDEDEKRWLAEERELEDALEKGDWRPLPPEEKERMAAITKQAAAAYRRKDARINIRLSSADLELLKQRAAQEGLPYQTMIAGILHKVATGQWDGKERR